MTGVRSLTQPRPREHPPQPPPAPDTARLSLALCAEKAALAASAVAAMTGSRYPGANPRPMRGIGLFGKLGEDGRQFLRPAGKRGHSHLFNEYDLYGSN